MSETDRDYLLGTHDEEIARLGLQHRVWQPRTLASWRAAGFTVGQTILDIGAGPGYAALDLAAITGPTGRVIALERSRRFLDVLAARADIAGLANITGVELDLETDALPAVHADAAWGRWIFAFLRDPRAALAKVREALRPGASLVLYEYLDYTTWSLLPRVAEIEALVPIVVSSWRAAGGDPDVGREIPAWLDELGFDVRVVRPMVDVVTPVDYTWQWPATFVEVGVARLVATGYLDEATGHATIAAYRAASARPETRMITPMVAEIIAVRR
jgi:SAM-dependent methyltransferase